jgi:hypothetical protein
MKTLLLAHSFDATADALIGHLGTENIFRLNSDLIGQYRVAWSRRGLTLESPVDSVTDAEIAKVFWRKPFQGDWSGDPYAEAETRYFFRELFNFFDRQNKTVLVRPYRENEVGKIVQLLAAEGLFAVPEWHFRLNRPFGGGDRTTVVKSLSGNLVDAGHALYTTGVAAADLAPEYPWFVQTRVEAESDVTVVFVEGALFSFALARDGKTVDWRRDIGRKPQPWQPHPLPDRVSDNIRSLMQRLDLPFGRLDFLLAKGKYVFLEVNPNGQWAWLDLDDRHGLLSAMAERIRP